MSISARHVIYPGCGCGLEHRWIQRPFSRFLHRPRPRKPRHSWITGFSGEPSIEQLYVLLSLMYKPYNNCKGASVMLRRSSKRWALLSPQGMAAGWSPFAVRHTLGEAVLHSSLVSLCPMLSAVLLICLPKAFCSSAFGGNRAPRAAPRAPIRPRQSFASFAFLGPRCDSAFAKCESNPSTSSQPHLECHGHLSR